FLFQAEDGIRALTVTGVQTCALPISRVRRKTSLTRPPAFAISRRTLCRKRFRPGIKLARRPRPPRAHGGGNRDSGGGPRACRPRSEERRVGKECRCRCGWYDYKGDRS